MLFLCKTTGKSSLLLRARFTNSAQHKPSFGIKNLQNLQNLAIFGDVLVLLNLIGLMCILF